MKKYVYRGDFRSKMIKKKNHPSLLRKKTGDLIRRHKYALINLNTLRKIEIIKKFPNYFEVIVIWQKL